MAGRVHARLAGHTAVEVCRHILIYDLTYGCRNKSGELADPVHGLVGPSRGGERHPGRRSPLGPLPLPYLAPLSIPSVRACSDEHA